MTKRGLTPTQAGELWRAASTLPPAQRDAFIAAVHVRLRSLPHRLNDGDVQSAIVTVLGDASITTTSCFMCDAAPTQEADMAATNYDDDDESPFDERGILKDGHKVRISLQMRDAAMRDTVASLFDSRKPGFVTAADARRRRKVTTRDPFGRETGTWEEEEDAASAYAEGRARKEKAYSDMVADTCSAWRNPAPMFSADIGEGPPRGAKEGDVCTIDGAPGHLNAKLECVADRRDAASVPRTTTADEARQIRKRAYDEAVAESLEAWRTP